MKIAVCIKQVPTREWQPRLSDDETWIREQDVSYEMNEPDAYALEEALRLREKHGGEVVVCSAGPARVQQVLREALARGADRALHVEDDSLASADAFVSAGALAAAMADEKFDLVLTGLQSDDQGHGQTGVVLAERLGIPHSTIIMEIQVQGGGRQVLRRRPRADWCARQARARGGLVPVGGDAAARAADDPERHQPAALRHAQRDHGGQEEGDPEGRPAGRAAAVTADRRAGAADAVQTDTDDRRVRRPKSARELVRRLRDEARAL